MKRWPIIRHVRYFYLRTRFNIWWNTIGHVLGAFPNPSDIEFLEAVWKGDA